MDMRKLESDIAEAYEVPASTVSARWAKDGIPGLLLVVRRAETGEVIQNHAVFVQKLIISDMLAHSVRHMWAGRSDDSAS